MVNDNIPTLGKMEVVIGEETETLNLDAILPIEEDLSREFSRQPSLYAYVAMLAAQAESMWAQAKQQTERIRAQTDKEVREKAKLHDEKMTEAIVSNRIALNDNVQAAEDEEAGYRYQWLMLRAVVQSMDQRAQMLISLGAHMRAEAEQSGMIIRDTKSRLDAIKEKRGL